MPGDRTASRCSAIAASCCRSRATPGSLERSPLHRPSTACPLLPCPRRRERDGLLEQRRPTVRNREGPRTGRTGGRRSHVVSLRLYKESGTVFQNARTPVLLLHPLAHPPREVSSETSRVRRARPQTGRQKRDATDSSSRPEPVERVRGPEGPERPEPAIRLWARSSPSPPRPTSRAAGLPAPAGNLRRRSVPVAPEDPTAGGSGRDDRRTPEGLP